MNTIPSQLEIELLKIASFIKDFSIPDSIPEMENALTVSIGYKQRIGEVLNDAELVYAKRKETCLASLGEMEDETETLRKAKLEAWTSTEKHQIGVLKNLSSNLKAVQMTLWQAIKTRRDER